LSVILLKDNNEVCTPKFEYGMQNGGEDREKGKLKKAFFADSSHAKKQDRAAPFMHDKRLTRKGKKLCVIFHFPLDKFFIIVYKYHTAKL
jgi:hypothetical protein